MFNAERTEEKRALEREIGPASDPERKRAGVLVNGAAELQDDVLAVGRELDPPHARLVQVLELDEREGINVINGAPIQVTRTIR